MSDFVNRAMEGGKPVVMQAMCDHYEGKDSFLGLEKITGAIGDAIQQSNSQAQARQQARTDVIEARADAIKNRSEAALNRSTSGQQGLGLQIAGAASDIIGKVAPVVTSIASGGASNLLQSLSGAGTPSPVAPQGNTASQPNTPATPATLPDDHKKTFMYIGIGVAVLVVIVLLFVFMKKGK